MSEDGAEHRAAARAPSVSASTKARLRSWAQCQQALRSEGGAVVAAAAAAQAASSAQYEYSAPAHVRAAPSERTVLHCITMIFLKQHSSTRPRAGCFCERANAQPALGARGARGNRCLSHLSAIFSLNILRLWWHLSHNKTRQNIL